MAITIKRSSGLSGASEPLIQRLRDVVADATKKPHATNLGYVRDTLDLIKAERALHAYDRELERERRATTLPVDYEEVMTDKPHAFRSIAGDIYEGYPTRRRMHLEAWKHSEHPEEFVPPEPYDQEEDQLIALQVRTGSEVQTDGRHGVVAVHDNVSLAWLGRFDEHIATTMSGGAIPIFIEAYVDDSWVTKLEGVFIVTNAKRTKAPAESPFSGDVHARAEDESREALRNAMALIVSQARSDQKRATREVVCAAGEMQ